MEKVHETVEKVVELVGSDNQNIYFKLTVNGIPNYGSIAASNSIIVLGREMGHGSSLYGEEAFKHLFNNIKHIHPVRAEVFRKKKRTTKQIDSFQFTLEWAAVTLFVGDETNGFIGGSFINGAKFVLPPYETATFYDVKGVLQNPLNSGIGLTLDIQSEDDESLIGQKIYLVKNRIDFADGTPTILSRSFKLESIPLETEMFCDIIREERNNGTSFFAITASKGCKTDPELKQKYLEVKRESWAAELEHFLKQDDGIAVGGILKLTTSKFDQRRFFRIIFDRQVASFFNASLAHADIAALLTSEAEIKVHFERTELSSGPDLERAKRAYNYNTNGLRFFKAKRVIVESPISMGFSSPQADVSELSNFEPAGGLLERFTKFIAKRGLSLDGVRSILIGATKWQDVESGLNPYPLQPAINNESHDKGVIFELIAPRTFNSPTTKGLMKIKSGRHANQIGFFSRENVYIFGHHLSEANLMSFDCSTEFNVETIDSNLSGFSCIVTKAWIGTPPNQGPIDISQNNAFHQWWVSAEKKTAVSLEEFELLVSGKNGTKPYFTHIPHEKDATRYNSNLEKVYLRNEDQFGILKILDGALKGTSVAVKSKEVFLMLAPLCFADLSFLLSHKIFVEVRRLEIFDETDWSDAFKCAKQEDQLFEKPTYVATLAYIGSRPKPHPSWLELPSLDFIRQNENLVKWLKKRHLSPQKLVDLIKGNSIGPLNHIQSSQQPRITPQEQSLNPPSLSQPLLTPPSVKSQWNESNVMTPSSMVNPSMTIVEQTRNRAHTIIENILKCVSPLDPLVSQIVRNESDFEMASFIVETLGASLKSYEASNRSSFPTQSPSRPSNQYSQSSAPSRPSNQYSQSSAPSRPSNFITGANTTRLGRGGKGGRSNRGSGKHGSAFNPPGRYSNPQTGNQFQRGGTKRPSSEALFTRKNDLGIPPSTKFRYDSTDFF